MNEQKIGYFIYEEIGMSIINQEECRDYNFGDGIHIKVPKHLWEEFERIIATDEFVMIINTNDREKIDKFLAEHIKDE